MRRREQRRRSLLSAAWRGRAQATLRSVPLAAALLFGFPVVCEVQEMVDEEGNRYLGEVVDGVRAGQGRYEWTNGNIYEGTFENNEISGSGVFTWPDGRRYEGEFSQGMKHGQGEYTWPNGDTYLGQYENDQISGTGVFTWAETKAKYEGQFRNGRKHGRGVYTWPDSRRYEGQFVNDQRDGLGIVREVDGSAFQGYFVQNRKHGIGVVFAEDGSREVQEWRNGEMIHSEQVNNRRRVSFDDERIGLDVQK